jgi:hypothetical protein
MDTGIVVLAVAVVVGTSEYKSVAKGGGFVMRPVIAGFVLGTLLLAVGAGNSGLGVAFCWLVIVGSILRNGSGLLTGATNVVTAKTSKGK